MQISVQYFNLFPTTTKTSLLVGGALSQEREKIQEKVFCCACVVVVQQNTATMNQCIISPLLAVVFCFSAHSVYSAAHHPEFFVVLPKSR